MKINIFLIIIFSFCINVYSAEEFSGNIDFSQTFWVRMMGYPNTVPKWIKVPVVSPGFKTTQGFNQPGDFYRQNLHGQQGSFFQNSRIFRVESDLMRPSATGYKIQVGWVRDSRFQGKNVKAIDHDIYAVYSANMPLSVPLSGNFIFIDDLVGGGSHYNYLKDPTTSTEIILYDNKQGNPGTNTGSYNSYGRWIKGTPIITNWKGVNEPHTTLDKYENDPKYAKYKSETFHNPEEGRIDDKFVPKPDRLNGDNANDIMGDLANITDVDGCLDLNPLEPVTWNIDSYIGEVSDVVEQKYDLTFFDSSVPDGSLPDYTLQMNFLGDEMEFPVVADGKLQAGDQTENIDYFFGLSRSIILIFIGLYAVTHLFSILRR